MENTIFRPVTENCEQDFCLFIKKDNILFSIFFFMFKIFIKSIISFWNLVLHVTTALRSNNYIIHDHVRYDLAMHIK